jgi:hypothetical protein
MLKKGMTVVETVVAVAIFALICGTAYDAYIAVDKLVIKSDHASKARSLAEEGIEAVRSIRDQDFTLLSAGTKGLSLSSGSWQFSGTSDNTDGYIRKTILAQRDSNSFYATSTVEWLERGASTTESASAVVSNWHKSVGMADTLTIDTSGAYLALSDTTRLLTGINLISDGSYGTTTITKVQATWSGVVSTRRLTNIRSPNGTDVWTGSSASGVINTLSTSINLAGAVTRSIEFRYNATMVGLTSITLVFTMSDASTKSVTITNPPSQ